MSDFSGQPSLSRRIAVICACATAAIIWWQGESCAQNVTSMTGYSAGSARASGMQNDPGLPRVFAPTQPRTTYTRYPWKNRITATVFWIGEKPTARNPTPNDKSSWDTKWKESYGGYDDPNPANRTSAYHPKGFTPKQNPFYIALPYKDTVGWARTKPEAKRVIPWFEKEYRGNGKSVCRSRWIAIRKDGKVCYAQWEDCGPWVTDDWAYVFGSARPKNPHNSNAGLDVSPAVRDFLGLGSTDVVDWRFVDIEEVPRGPWSVFGDNNHFLKLAEKKKQDAQNELARLKALRDAAYMKQGLRR